MKKQRVADLHTHTVHSDGTYTVEELFEMAKNLNLIGISITDHDTLDGVLVAQELMMSKNYPFVFIPGCEFTTYLGDEEIHIIGYFLDPYDDELQNYLKNFRESRYRRVKKILRCLSAKGINLTLEDIGYTNGNPIGRMHVARAMVSKGFVDTVEDAFKLYLDKGKPCYFKRKKVKTTKVIQLIRNVGGIAVGAHPLWLKRQDGLKILKHLIKYGLSGLEFRHPYIDEEFSARIKDLAETHRLVLTAGSDFHGEMSTRNKLATNFLTEEEFIKFLKQAEFSILSWR